MDYEKLRQFFNENDPYSRYSHISITKMEPGRSEVELTIFPENLNYMGILHGGALYTLADVAAGVALVSRGSRCVTIQADLHFLKVAYDGTIKAFGKQIHQGRSTGVSEVTIYNEAGDLICTGTCTMFFTGQPYDFFDSEK